MNPTTIAFIGLVSGMAGALIIEGLKLAYHRWQASRQPATRVLETRRAAAAVPAPLPEPTDPAPFDEISASPPLAEAEPSPLPDETTAAAPRAAPPIAAPVNPAINEADLQPAPAGQPDISRSGPDRPEPGRDGDRRSGAHPRSPIRVYSQGNSVLATLENSEEVEAVLRASRGRPGRSAPPPTRKPPEPEPGPAGPETPRVARPELRKSLEEQAAAMPGGVPLWVVYVVLGASIVLALGFLFLALQPLLTR